jgi:hypothetical protein
MKVNEWELATNMYIIERIPRLAQYRKKCLHFHKALRTEFKREKRVICSLTEILVRIVAKVCQGITDATGVRLVQDGPLK